ncbi:MAG: hypothetical protein AAGD25_17645, partial [Cyanobacteria bacterium P01_F01_bin.150]
FIVSACFGLGFTLFCLYLSYFFVIFGWFWIYAKKIICGGGAPPPLLPPKVDTLLRLMFKA